MRTFLLLLALGSVLSGCQRDTARPDASTIPPEAFARVLAELSQARVEALPDTALYRRRRIEILERAGVTENDQRVFVARHGGDPDLMLEIYRQVGSSLDSAAQR